MYNVKITNYDTLLERTRLGIANSATPSDYGYMESRINLFRRDGTPLWIAREYARYSIDDARRRSAFLDRFASDTFVYDLMTAAVHTELALFFPHIPRSSDALSSGVAVTQSWEKGERDLQTIMKIGKFLTMATDWDRDLINRIANCYTQSGQQSKLEFATTIHDIRTVYADCGTDSCMSKSTRYFGFKPREIYNFDKLPAYMQGRIKASGALPKLKRHALFMPIDWYAMCPDAAVAYYRNSSGRVQARAVVNIEYRTFVRVYGNPHLFSLLENAGFTKTEALELHGPILISPETANSNSPVMLMPYIDGESESLEHAASAETGLVAVTNNAASPHFTRHRYYQEGGIPLARRYTDTIVQDSSCPECGIFFFGSNQRQRIEPKTFDKLCSQCVNLPGMNDKYKEELCIHHDPRRGYVLAFRPSSTYRPNIFVPMLHVVEDPDHYLSDMAHHVDELHADKIRVRDVATLERIHQHDNEDLIRGLFSFSPEACETLARAQLVDVPGVPGTVMPKRYLRKSLVVREDEVVCVKTIRVNERADRVLLPDADRALLTNRYGTSVIYQDAAPAMFKIGLLTTCSVGHATCLTKMCVEAKGKQGRTYPVHVTRAIYVRKTNEWLDLYAYELARDTVPLDISLVDLTKDLTKKTARLVGLARHVIEDYSMPPFTDQGRAPVWYDPVTGKSTISSIDDVEVFYSNNTTSR